MRLWERICEDFGKDSQDFGRGFTRTLGGFVRLWERICETFGEDS